LAAFLLLASCEPFEKIERSYDTYDDAAAADAVGEGRWLPAFLPRSARRIRELHDIDTNEMFVRFDLAAADADTLSTALVPADRASVVLPRRRRVPRWWPHRLSATTERTLHPLPDVGFFDVGFAGETRGQATSRFIAFLALDRRSGTAHYWAFRSYEKQRPADALRGPSDEIDSAQRAVSEL